jgi:3-methyladenine DNA glycosylase AlkD
MVFDAIQKELDALASPEAARTAQWFFKTGPGEYGEGDVFRGIRVPVLRKLAGKYGDIGLSDAERLLELTFHEDRLLALFILVRAYAGGDEAARLRIFGLYLRHTRHINNWDLVDSSAEHIVGAHVRMNGERETLTKLAGSSSLWERRIAIMATFHFIKKGEFAETLRIAQLLLHDPEDLIHKAVGWMLREIGKRSMPAEEEFLRDRYKEMPRTMLRYAIERFPEPLRLAYLKGTV